MARISLLSLVFIDSAINYDWVKGQLNHGMLDLSSAEVEIIVLNADGNGIEQITDVLAHRSHVQSLHLMTQSSAVSHLQLGSDYLTRFNLDRYGWQLQSWGDALAPQAHIVIYGCAASDELDNPFMQRLSLLTGVAVSCRCLPEASPGEDWSLQVS